MTTNDFTKALDEKMIQAVSSFRGTLGGVRTNKASPSMLDGIQVDAYGSKMPLSQVASVTAPDPRMLLVQVWDSGLSMAVDKAIRSSALNLNPVTEGATLRINLPDLNEERRRELVALAHKYSEAAKVTVRHIRRDGIDQLRKSEKSGDINEDDLASQSQTVQELTDDHIQKITDMTSVKEKEIMTV